MNHSTSFHDHMKLGDHDHHQLQLFNQKLQASSSTISSNFLSYSNVHEDHGSCYRRETLQLKYQQEANNFASQGGSSDGDSLKLCLWKNENGQVNQISSDPYENIPTKWLPSKLRLGRRMTGSDRTASEAPAKPQIEHEDYHKEGSLSRLETSQNSSNSSSSTPIRVCSNCNTTKTPLWRSGPKGPKSLCNACGIRQRKARRAMAAVAAANGTTMVVKGTTPSKPKVQQKYKRLKINTQIAPCKKRFKHGNNNKRKDKLCFEDFLISLSKNLAFHNVFPQDEKEAAILLMALSSGLVHG